MPKLNCDGGHTTLALVTSVLQTLVLIASGSEIVRTLTCRSTKGCSMSTEDVGPSAHCTSPDFHRDCPASTPSKAWMTAAWLAASTTGSLIPSGGSDS